MRYLKIIMFTLVLFTLGSGKLVQAGWDVRPAQPAYYFLPGENFSVEIKLTGSGETVDALGFDFTFPAELLDYSGYDFTGSLLESWMFKDVLSPEAGTIRIAGFTATGAISPPDSGTLVTLNFTVKTPVSGSGQLCLVGFTDDLVAATTECSEFSPAEPVPMIVGPADSLYGYSPGQSFSVVIRLSETNVEVDALGFDFHFADSLLQYDGFDFTGTLMGNWMFKDVQLSASGTIRTAGFTANEPIALDTTGQLVQFRFTVKADAAGESRFTLDGLTDDLVTAVTDSATFSVLQLPVWEVPVKVIADQDTTCLSFGGHPNASDFYDADFDKPSAPPGFDLFACFSLATFPDFLVTDIRRWVAPYDTAREWTLNILNVTGQNIDICWDSATLPAEGIFTLDGLAHPVNMRQSDSVQVNQDVTLKIRYQPGVTTCFDFPKAGWYLISLPVFPADRQLSVLFPEATHAFAFNSGTRAYEAVTQLEPKIGYWLLVPAASRVELTGMPLTNYQQNYAMGWHCVGAVIDSLAFTEPNDKPDGSVLAAFGWNDATQAYETVYPNGIQKLAPNQGYWLAVAQPCTLSFGFSAFSGTGKMVAAEKFNAAFGPVPPPPPFATTVDKMQSLPVTNSLAGNFPNPFNPETTIQFSLRDPGVTQLSIFNALGQRVRVLENSFFPSGTHRIAWDGKNDHGELVPSGIYFMKIRTATWHETRKMVLMK